MLRIDGMGAVPRRPRDQVVEVRVGGSARPRGQPVGENVRAHVEKARGDAVHARDRRRGEPLPERCLPGHEGVGGPALVAERAFDPGLGRALTPGGVGPGRDANLVEVVDREVVEPPGEVFEHGRLSGRARAGEDEEH